LQKKKKEKKNYGGREGTPYIKGKRNTQGLSTIRPPHQFKRVRSNKGQEGASLAMLVT